MPVTRRLVFATPLLFVALECAYVVAAQQPKIFKIGELTARPGLRRSADEFVRALRELGYVEGKNLAFELRSAEGKFERFPALADELVRQKVDVLVATSTPEALAFKNATKTIPIVFYTGSDPIEVGLVDSLARPSGNITGVTLISAQLIGKRLELLTATIPKLSRVAVLWNSPNRKAGQEKPSVQFQPSLQPARELGIQLHSMEVRSAEELDRAFKEAVQAGSSAIAVQLSPLIAANQKQIVALAAKHKLPTVYPRVDFVHSGGLMSYGADRDEPYRRLAVMVDKILKGAKPADLPVEQPTKFELVINLKTAKQIGLTIPPNVLARADKIIR
jgi:putative ABC transport system substrate-binding protein